ncbi:MAG TPA: DUF2934 domain-containing protein [Myxococcaceae bacterium]|jgi:hypothetical protein
MPRKITKTEKPAEQVAETTAEKTPTPVTAKAARPVQVSEKNELVPNQPASDETRSNRPPSHEEISRRAYELWAKRGGMGGNAQEDWLRAEQELRARR